MVEYWLERWRNIQDARESVSRPHLGSCHCLQLLYLLHKFWWNLGWGLYPFGRKPATKLFLFLAFFFGLFRAAPAAYGGGSQPRGLMGAVAAGLYTTATAAWDPSHVGDLHHSSQQHQALNPLSKARDQTCILIDASQIHFHWATTGTPRQSSSVIEISSCVEWFFGFFSFPLWPCPEHVVVPRPGIEPKPLQW